MIVTINGIQGEGKTTLSKSIFQGRQTYMVEEYEVFENPFWASGVKENEVIIVEESIYVNKIFEYFNKAKLVINRKGQTPVEIDMPDVIIIHCTDVKPKAMEYKFRAECITDIFRVLPQFKEWQFKEWQFVDFDPDPCNPVFTFESILNRNEIIDRMREIEDSHVMMQTIQPTEEYTGERDFDIN